MAAPTNDQVTAEIAELRAANANLTQELDREQALKATLLESSSSKRRPRRRWGRGLFAAVLIVIGALLAPVAVVSTWANQQLTDTEFFVSTFAPLAQEPAVQDLVTAQAVAAIESAIDIDQIANDLFAGLNTLEIGPQAKAAITLLQGPAVSGVKSLIQSTVQGFVQSDVFATIWRETLEVTHRQLVKTATGQADAAISVGSNQQIVLELEPIIRAVKTQLVDSGFTLAERIPTLSVSIVLAEDTSIGTFILIYQLVVALGVWVPWIMLLVLAAGVLVAPRRALALVWASGAVLTSMLLVGGGIAVGHNIFALAVAQTIPHNAALVIYSEVLGFVTSMILALGTVAATVLVVTLLAGPWAWARALRGKVDIAISALRNSAERHHISTGRFGQWLYRWQKTLRFVVGLVGAAVILLVRPLTPGMIVWTGVLAVLTLLLLDLLSRPVADSAGAGGAEVDIAKVDSAGADGADAGEAATETTDLPTVNAKS